MIDALKDNMSRKTFRLSFIMAAFCVFSILSPVPRTEGAVGKDSAVPARPEKGLVTVELKEGEKVMGRITRETRDDVYILYPNETFEAVIPRFKIEDIRKPTAEELTGLERRSSEESKQQ